jgi:Fe-S cluster assembly iron-binding protein IscA
MLTVTEHAKKRFKQALIFQPPHSGVAIRIVPSQKKGHSYGFTLDKEKQGDTVVNDKAGEKVLIIGRELVPDLKGKTLDYKNNKFTLVD